LPKHAKVLTTTWAMKKKASGKYKARLAARGFKQVDGIHYDQSDKAAPVVNDITVRIILVLICMALWCAHLMDVRGAFLLAEFEPHH
jgi:hypothetical protein